MLEFNQWDLFFGRFHPLIVHFPIGILLVVLFLEIIALKRNEITFKLTIHTLLKLGTFSAILAAVLGFLLADDGSDYNESRLFWHRTLGIAVCLFGIIATYLHSYYLRQETWLRRLVYLFFLMLCNGALVVGSHHGGVMTHGAHYLTRYAPQFKQPVTDEVVAKEKQPTESIEAEVIDEADTMDAMQMENMGATVEVASDALIEPAMTVLNEYCISCHGPDKVKGHLRLDLRDDAFAAGKSGEIAIVPGNAAASEVIKRMQLPLEDDDHMPPEKKVQPKPAELQILIDWINAGAPWAQKKIFNAVKPKSKPNPVTEFEQQLSPEALKAIAALEAQNVEVKLLAWENYGLLINFEHYRETITAEAIKQVQPLADYVFWFDLGNSKLAPNALAALKNFPEIKRLNLERTAITDKACSTLRSLKELEYLNLYDTQVGDNGLAQLKNLKKLGKLYVWNTKASARGKRDLKKALPQLEIIDGT